MLCDRLPVCRKMEWCFTKDCLVWHFPNTQSPNGNMAAYLERAGAALSALHDIPPDIAQPLQIHDFAAEVIQVARASAHIRVLLPPSGQSIDEILNRALELHKPLPAAA